jgi:hypothetical protein
MLESWCDPHINQPRLCIPTSEPSAGLAPSEVMLGRTAFTHQEPQPGGDVWIIDVDTERIAGSRQAIPQRVAVHAKVTGSLCPLPTVAQVCGHCRDDVLALLF